MSTTATEDFLDRIREAVANGTLRRLILAAYRGSERGLRRLQVRPVVLQAGPRLSFVWSHATRDITKNFEVEAGLELIAKLVGTDFASGHLYSETATWQLEHRPGRLTRLTRSAPVQLDGPISTDHDRPKARVVNSGEPWLRALEVIGGHGEVRREMEAKYRQIHRFVELLEPVLAATQPNDGSPLRVVDMGCGKGYLTFATYFHLLRRYPSRKVHVLGLEARPELVAKANRVATECGAENLRFQEGAIAALPVEPVTGVIALHACDTATDDALAWGIAAGADWLMVSPCCHREIRGQLVPPPVLQDPLRHGILAERHAEFVTDALRSALLEWIGYQSRVFEFISTEHTAKNLMITGVRREAPASVAHRAEVVRKLAAEYGVRRHQLASRLGFQLLAEIL